MIADSQKTIDALREGGGILAAILREVAGCAHVGIATRELDRRAVKRIREAGGKPAFKNYQTRGTEMPYPATLCVSVNDEVVHGIPSGRILKDGDIIGLDIGMKYKRFFTDMAVTIGIGSVAPEYARLISVTRRALEIGIAQAQVGAHVGDIGEAIQIYIEKEKFAVVRELVGHGVGKSVHEDPEVPNWGRKGTGQLLADGLVIAIEPMAAFGSPRIRVSKDGWVWSTADGKPAAHFEHTILVTKNGPEIITN